MALAEGPDNSVSLSSRQFAATAAATALGAATFYLIGAWCPGWWWDGFWLCSLGMLFGQTVGLLGFHSLGRKTSTSDRPLVLGNATGVGMMVAVWLCLPEGVVANIAHIARGVCGAAVAVLVVLVLEPYDSVAQAKGRS